MHTGRCFGSQTIARFFLSLLFVVSSVNFLMHFANMTKTVATGLAPVGLSSVATLATILAIIFQLGGGLMLMWNYQTSLAAWMLIIFLVLATLMYHTNWTGTGGTMQMLSFLENLAIIGGLMFYARCHCSGCKEKCENDTCCQKKEEISAA